MEARQSLSLLRIGLVTLAAGLALVAAGAAARFPDFGLASLSVGVGPPNPALASEEIAPLAGIGTIEGTVYYTGTVTGTHLVWVAALTTTGDGEGPVGFTTRAGPGPYSFAVAEGTYNIFAAMDADDDGNLNPAVDPMSLYANNPVTVTAGETITGIDIILVDPAPTPSGSISGQVSYTGWVTIAHNIIVVAGLVDQGGPPTNAAIISGPGYYTITGVADGTYYVLAFMDVGGDMGPPEPNEPFAFYDPDGDGAPDSVVVSEGNPVTGIDIALRDQYLRRTYLPIVTRDWAGQ